jgi:hypothetical protein
MSQNIDVGKVDTGTHQKSAPPGTRDQKSTLYTLAVDADSSLVLQYALPPSQRIEPVMVKVPLLGDQQQRHFFYVASSIRRSWPERGGRARAGGQLGVGEGALPGDESEACCRLLAALVSVDRAALSVKAPDVYRARGGDGAQHLAVNWLVVNRLAVNLLAVNWRAVNGLAVNWMALNWRRR